MESSTYSSFQTGVEYRVVPEVHQRMRGGILEGCEMYWADVTQYNIMLNGERVNHCFEEGDIPLAIYHYENPLTDAQVKAISSRFD